MSVETYKENPTDEEKQELAAYRETRRKEREESEQAEWDRLKALPWHEYIIAIQGNPPVSVRAQYYVKDKEGDLRFGTYVTPRMGSNVAHFAPGQWLYLRIRQLPEGVTQ